MSLIRKSIIVTTFILVLNQSHAVEFEVPAWASGADAEYSGWESFSSGFGAPGNEPDVEGSDAGGLITQNTPGGSVTGSGNIYNPAGASMFILTDTAERNYQQVVLQAKSIGALNAEAVTLSYEVDGETLEMEPGESREIAREAGGFGDTILHLWSWDLSAVTVSEIQIVFAAQASHLSLDAVRLDTLLQPVAASIVHIDSPSMDRWNYFFNATPGRRPKASVFRAVEEDGVYRHGTYVFGFDTSDQIPAGHSPDSYQVEYIKIRLLTSSGFETPYDPTYDPVVSSLPEDNADYQADTDPGRPIEIFGTGFRNEFTSQNWVESAPYAPGPGSAPNVFPAVMNQAGDIVDVSLAVDYSDPKDLQPFAAGVIEDAIPGDLIPEESWMYFDFDMDASNALAYIQQGLADGRLMFTATSLASGGQGDRSYPEFHTADSLLGEPPAIEIAYRMVEQPTTMTISTLGRVEGHWTLSGTVSVSAALGIRWTHDLVEWHEVTEPNIEINGDGQWSWTDSDTDSKVKFFQVYIR